MKKVIAALSILFLGCTKENKESERRDDFISQIRGEAYMGPATSKLYVNGHDPLPSLVGKATLSADKIKGDSLTLAILAEFPEDDGFTLGIPGKQDQTSWSATFPNGKFSIGGNGTMTGSFSDGKKELSWDGNLGNGYAIFDVRIKYLVKDGNIPASSILVTHLDLSRFPDQSSTNPAGCKLDWQMRSVFNIYSGGTDLMRVPVCL